MWVYVVWRNIDRSFNEILFWYGNGNHSQGFDEIVSHVMNFYYLIDISGEISIILKCMHSI